jgi:ADP-heptose:LPS heptosyltransferase
LRTIVFRGGALGDLILTLPAVQALRSIADHICLVAPDPQRVLARSFVDESFDLNSAAMAPLFGPDQIRSKDVFKSLGEFDFVLSYLSDSSTTFRTNVVAATSARFVQGPSRIDESGPHAVAQLAAPVSALTGTVPKPYPEIPVENKVPIRDIVAIHVGSGAPRKNWLVEKWALLSEWLLERFEKLLLVVGEADHETSQALIDQIGKKGLEVITTPSLEELCSRLAGCRFYVGHDTGVSHLAAAVGVPTVTLFFCTNPAVWASANPKNLVVSATSAEALSTEELKLRITQWREFPSEIV